MKSSRKKLSKAERQLFGKYKSGKKDLATNRKKYFREGLLKKYVSKPNPTSKIKDKAHTRRAAAFKKEFGRIRKKFMAEAAKRGIFYTEEQIFKMVS